MKFFNHWQLMVTTQTYLSLSDILEEPLESEYPESGL